MLVIVIALVVAIAIGVILEEKSITYGGGAALTIVCSVILFIILLVWFVNFTHDVSYIQTFEATKQTVETQRNAGIDPLERAKLTEEIIRVNSWLARAKYWNSTFFEQMVPDAVMLLEPIE